jgi:hypothetical protein
MAINDPKGHSLLRLLQCEVIGCADMVRDFVSLTSHNASILALSPTMGTGVGD